MVRRATADDWPAAAEVIAEGFATYQAFAGPAWEPPADMVDERVGVRLAREDNHGFIAFDGDEPVGFGGFRPSEEPGLAHVWAVFVKPSHWGRGIATEILAALVGAMDGFTQARLITPAGQARARAFYRREGWREVDEPFFEPRLGFELVEFRRDLWL